jgi:hypothetical protein
MRSKNPSGEHYKPSDIAPDFIRQVEEELFRRLGQRVTVRLGDGIIVLRAEGGSPFAGRVIVTERSLLRSRTRPQDWADVLERKITGDDLSGLLAAQVHDVEHLFAEIQKSPSPERSGEIVLDHVGGYDGAFFEALGEVIARDKARGRSTRARKFEALDEYLREVRRRARKGETAQMRRELARGAAQEGEMSKVSWAACKAGPEAGHTRAAAAGSPRAPGRSGRRASRQAR